MRYISYATAPIASVGASGAAAALSTARSFALGVFQNGTPALSYRLTFGAGTSNAEVSAAIYYCVERIDLGDTPFWQILDAGLAAGTTAATVSLPAAGILLSVMCSSASAPHVADPQWSYTILQPGET